MLTRAWRNDTAFIAIAGGLAALTAAVYALSAYAISPFVLPALAIGGAAAAAAVWRPALGVAAAFVAAPLESASLPLPTGSLSPSEGLLAVGAGVLGLIGTLRYLQSGNAVVFDSGSITGARAAGTFADPNYYGSLLQLALVPGVALLLTRARSWTLGLPLAFAFSGLVFSLSRGAALGFAMALIVLLAWNRARWLAFVLLSVVAITTMLNVNPLIGSQQLTTVEQRLSSITTAHESQTNNRPRIWAAAINETEQHPFLGVGLNQFSQVASEHGVTERGSPLENAHNVFLSLSVETGLLGLSLFIGFIWVVGLRAVRAITTLRDPALRGLALGLMATLVGFLVQGLTANQLHDNLIAAVVLVLSGMLVALGREGGPFAEE